MLVGVSLGCCLAFAKPLQDLKGFSWAVIGCSVVLWVVVFVGLIEWGVWWWVGV
jgi:hypothetical protein